MSTSSPCKHQGRRHRLELADLVRDYGDSFRASRRLSGAQLAALGAIKRCRTPALGGCREVCSDCGRERLVWRSCRNRHCPKCQTVAKERWLDARLQELLPVDYIHVVFTLPHDLNAMALRRPRMIYGLLFRSAADTLLEFAKDPRYLGAEPGILTILHTWGQNLSLHIHLHCIVTLGGLNATKRRWVRRSSHYLFPVKAMSVVFRGKYIAGLKKEIHDGQAADIPLPKIRENSWVVYAKKPFGDPRKVLEYLARYTNRVALTNDRLLGMTDGTVRLRWRDYAHGGRKKVMRLKPEDLLHRFVQHVLPRGFCRIRHYGLLSNRHKAEKLAACRRYFGTEQQPVNDVGVTGRILNRLGIFPDQCATCGSFRIIRIQLTGPAFDHRARAPT